MYVDTTLTAVLISTYDLAWVINPPNTRCCNQVWMFWRLGTLVWLLKFTDLSI